MEKTRDMAVVEYSGFWTDLGGWNAVSAIAKVDESRNSVVGNGHLFNSMNTYVHSEKTPTVVVGADNLIVINTVDATLVISKNQTHLLKSSLNSLLDKKIAQVKNHRKVYRPWGWYDLTDSGKNYLVKKVVVKPNQALSLQRHKHRSEHWVVVSGVATVRNGDSTFLLKKNESTYIPVGVLHRLENAGVSDLEIIEVQSGEILDEDDIERFDDNYGRI
jgi:mannose-1-phosphate guanylyltransferase/mannose-6-phosphate isomerase